MEVLIAVLSIATVSLIIRSYRLEKQLNAMIDAWNTHFYSTATSTDASMKDAAATRRGL